ncbi:MAG: hypothetical protein H6597_06110 [Flavobacteriales bacterium]|nr:hypothetical protein [Flavobacteriales bacterium]
MIRAVPDLERAWGTMITGDLFRNRIEDIYATIHLDTVHVVCAFGRRERRGPARRSIGISRYGYPGLDETHPRPIERHPTGHLAGTERRLTAFEGAPCSAIFFQVHGFKGNRKRNYHAPQNSSFINEVLDARKGNPLSLAIITKINRRRLDCPSRRQPARTTSFLALSGEGRCGRRTGWWAERPLLCERLQSEDILGKQDR